jgi:hypothetical protein
MGDWPFEDSENVATLTSRQVMVGLEPIVLVDHHAEDGMWEFGTGAAFSDADAMVVSLREVFDVDRSIGDVADLPPGWQASRTAAGVPWLRRIPG